MLGKVRPLVQEMRGLFEGLRAGRPQGALEERLVPAWYFRDAVRYRALRGRLRHLGVELQDPGSGRVGFPARRAGRPVWLCWRPGEPAPLYWHEWNEGYQARRPVDPEGPWDPPDL